MSGRGWLWATAMACSWLAFLVLAYAAPVFPALAGAAGVCGGCLARLVAGARPGQRAEVALVLGGWLGWVAVLVAVGVALGGLVGLPGPGRPPVVPVRLPAGVAV